MKNFEVALKIENLDELNDLLKLIKTNAEELEKNIEKLNNLELNVTQKSV